MWRAIPASPLLPMLEVDIEMLQGDAAKRQLYADLVETTVLPPLRAFCEIVATKSHLAPWFHPARLDKMMPGLGQSWAAKGALLNIFSELVSKTDKVNKDMLGRLQELQEKGGPGVHA